MIFQGFCSPFRTRFALFFVGMTFLGAVSAPLHAADSPAPTAWERFFGSKPKATESDPKEQKSKKAKTSKETQKKQKGSSTKKSGKETKVQAAAAVDAKDAESSPAPALPLVETIEASSLKTETTPNQVIAPDVTTTIAPTPLVNAASEGSSVPFWKRFFSAASSSLPPQEEVSQSNAPQPSSGVASPPPADVTTTAAPKPLVNEPSNIEPFWRRLFSGASSSLPPQEETTQSNVLQPSSGLASPAPADVTKSVAATPPVDTAGEGSSVPFWKRLFSGASSKQPDPNPEQASVTEPLKKAIPAPVTADSKSSDDEELPFWQKLFGSKPGDKKAVPSETKLIQAPAERSAVAPTLSSTLPPPVSPAPSTPTLPIVAAPPPSTTDTKSSFSLATVCEREKCELMVLFDAPINKSNVDKFIQSASGIPAGTAVLLNSTDGDINSGIRLGQVLRQKSFNTRIGRTQLNKKTLNEIDGQCYSSCVLAFAGGVNRRIDPNDKIGVYALRSNIKTVNENEMRTAVNNLGIYFDQMGIDRRLVDQMLEAKGSAVSPISLSSAKALNLDNGTRIITYPWRMQALDEGLLIILVTEKQSSNHFSITLGLTKQSKDKDFRLTVYAKPFSGNPNLNQLADYLNRESRLQIAFSNQTISPGLIKPWEVTSSGIQTAILLADKELTMMSSALEFELDLLQIQNNPYKLDSATIFGTSGLKGALKAIKK
jgi:hypothetical protein